MDQGWKIQDRFRNTSRDNMPAGETITSFGDRLIALADRVITEHGGAKTTVDGQTVYRINTEAPGNVWTLTQASSQPRMKEEIEKAIVSGASSQERARAAYLAICFDLAPGLRAQYPEKWAAAVEALAGYPNVMQALFYQAPTPEGERLREKALAAGLRKPVKAGAIK
jgi:hypothetical protein